jgi:hypothetical protein
MTKKLLYIYLLFLLATQKSAFPSNNYEWAVIGGGLAGITTVAVLLEFGVEPSTIFWIDPEFNVGRMGKYYRNVPANSKIQILQSYFNICPVLKKFPCASRDTLFSCNPNEFLPLKIIIDPLVDATNYLRSLVNSLQDTVLALTSNNDGWLLECGTTKIGARKVILAIGGYPKKLEYELQEIYLDEALDKNKLARYVCADDRIAVFGGMHSAMLMLKYVSELGVKQIINFYTTPYQYRIPGAESLEGITKEWVKSILEQKPPENLIRVKNTQENRDRYLHLCNKVIYAIGFERNPLSVNGSYDYTCDEKTGIIAPNLYGFGMAFPHTIKTLKCNKVAINGFAIYSVDAHNLIPKWKSQLR